MIEGVCSQDPESKPHYALHIWLECAALLLYNCALNLPDRRLARIPDLAMLVTLGIGVCRRSADLMLPATQDL